MPGRTNLIETIEIDLEREYLTDQIYIKEMEMKEMEYLSSIKPPAKISIKIKKDVKRNTRIGVKISRSKKIKNQKKS